MPSMSVAIPEVPTPQTPAMMTFLQAMRRAVLDNELVSSNVANHLHLESDITGLVTDLATLTSGLAGKADTAHTHAQSDITNLVSDLAGKAASSHSHVVGDITSFNAGVLTALAPPVVFTMSAKNSYQFGSLDPLGTGEPAKSWFNMAPASAAVSSANENTLCVHIVGSGSGGVLYQKAAILAQVVTTAGNSAANFTAGNIAAGVAIYGSAFINGVSGGTYGSAWGAALEASVISGNDGCAFGAELGVHLLAAGQESSDPDALHLLKVPVWVANGRYGYRNTAVIMNSPAGGLGAFYGSIYQGISLAYEFWRDPGASGCVGIDARSHANWGAIMHAPNVSSIRRWNAGNSATKLVIGWDDTASSIAIGETGDTVAIMTVAGQRVLELGAADSAGTGYKTVRVTN